MPHTKLGAEEVVEVVFTFTRGTSQLERLLDPVCGCDVSLLDCFYLTISRTLDDWMELVNLFKLFFYVLGYFI